MVHYRQSRIANAPYFLTAALRDRGSRLLLDHIEVLRSAFRCAAAQHPFHVDAVVVLPDHFHLLCTLPQGDADISVRMQTLDRRFAFGLMNDGAATDQHHRNEAGFRQLRFREHTIRDEADFARHVEYVHYNPVKHGLVSAAREWPHSSFHRYVRQGLVRADWGDSVPDEPKVPAAE